MDAVSITTAVIAAVSGYLARVGSGVGARIADDVVDRLYQVVSERLRATRLGSDALERLEGQPGDPAGQRTAALALEDEIVRDPQFGVALTELLAQVPPHLVVAAGDTAIVNTGQWDNRRGVVATGGSTVDQSRRFRLGTGGIAVAVIAAVLLLGVGSAAVINAVTDDPRYPELEGTWRPATIDNGSVRPLELPVRFRVSDDRWELEGSVREGGPAHCAGRLQQSGTTQAEGPSDGRSENTVTVYRLTTTQGSCPPELQATTHLLPGADGRVLLIEESSGDYFVGVR